MLTRLKVSGFKNLVDVDVRFGPFTCIAGANGVGKSNLFDAIRFLSALADRPLIDAARLVRGEGERTADVRSLFHRIGDTYADQMSFEVEMIVPEYDFDDLGQRAEATITFLKYAIELRYREDITFETLGSLEITREELSHINISDAAKNLRFKHNLKWRKSVIQGERRGGNFISTDKDHNNAAVIRQHQDRASGRPYTRLASSLPRTVLSTANAAETPTAVLARREMQSWRLLQLEPSAMRRPDEFTDPQSLGTNGSHLAATLHRIANLRSGTPFADDAQVYSTLANRLSQLLEDVLDIWVDRDEKRQLLTVQVRGRDGTNHAARALSDGTLRFLALAVLEMDPQSQGVICLEEPENGIHPKRVAAMLELLQDMSVDTDELVGIDNPLRQVIINTHSPLIVQLVPEDSLVIADTKAMISSSGAQYQAVVFGALKNTWRTEKDDTAIIAKGDILYYLNPVHVRAPSNGTTTKRVIDRTDLQILLPGID